MWEPDGIRVLLDCRSHQADVRVNRAEYGELVIVRRHDCPRSGGSSREVLDDRPSNRHPVMRACPSPDLVQ